MYLFFTSIKRSIFDIKSINDKSELINIYLNFLNPRYKERFLEKSIEYFNNEIDSDRFLIIDRGDVIYFFLDISDEVILFEKLKKINIKYTNKIKKALKSN
jgi:hypothetical protein